VGSRTWVANVAFVPAPGAEVRRGLLGWLSFDIDGTWHVDGVMLRRTEGGRLSLSFPSRIDRRGFEHAFLRPTCDRARRAIERAVLAELGLYPEAASPERPRPEDAPAELGLADRHGRQRMARGRRP